LLAGIIDAATPDMCTGADTKVIETTGGWESSTALPVAATSALVVMVFAVTAAVATAVAP
jgi:hypothetical protein